MLKNILINPYIKYKRFRANHSSLPSLITFFVTSKCNARCKHCFFWKSLNGSNDLTIDEIEKIFEPLKLRVLNLTGGEFSVRNDILNVCKIFSGRVRDIHINTNGILTEKIINITKELLNMDFKNVSVQVSLDGFEKTHDSIRRVNGCFKKAIDTISGLKKIYSDHLSVSVATVVMQSNFNEIEDLAEYLKNFDVEHAFLVCRNPKTPTETIGLPKLKIIYKKLLDLDVMSNVQRLKWEYTIKILETKEKVVDCFAGRLDGVIYSDGSVSFCEPLEPIDNLRKENYDLKKIWNSEKADLLREKIKNCFCIHPCALLSSIYTDVLSMRKLQRFKTKS